MENPELTLNHFIDYARQRRHLINESETVVEFIVAFIERALLSGNNHTYDDPYILCQLVSGAQGACFLHNDDLKESHLDGVVGRAVLDVVDNVPNHIGVTLLDACYSLINKQESIVPNEVIEFEGLGSVKSLERANKIIELAEIHSDSKVVLIGAIADLISNVISKGAELRVADFALAGKQMSHTQIEYDALPMIDWADTVILTGNTLKTNTLSQLLTLVRPSKARILIYAMTGANIAPHYIKHGAHIVTTEHFPFYWYANTKSKMCVYKQ